MLTTYKEESIETIIHKYIQPRKLHCTTVLIVLLILIFSVLHIYSIQIKVPIQKNTNLDLKEQIATADQFSWIIWAQLYSVWGIDIMRNVAKGLVPDDSA